LDKTLSTLLIFALFFGFAILIIGGVIVASIVQSRREKERTQQLQSTASFMGLEFAPTAPLDWIPHSASFELFNQGHSREIINAIYGAIGGIKAAVFDYRYVVGSGKSRHVYTQSVAYFEPRDLNLPSFSLRPENTLHKLIAVFGYQDIDFGNRPEFSSRYLLRGPDEIKIRNTFNDRVLSFYEANEGTCTDGGGSQLFIFRQNQRVDPLEVKMFADWAIGVKNLFLDHW
jgi:hypothetical protein